MSKLLILLTIFSIAGSEKISEGIQELQDLNSGIDNDSSFQIHRKLQEKCAKYSDCYLIPYSICSLGKCSCNHNYINSNERCLGLLEEMCELDDDCGVENSTCYFGFCRCKTDFQSQGITKCNQVPKLAPKIQKPKPGPNCSDDSKCPRTNTYVDDFQYPSKKPTMEPSGNINLSKGQKLSITCRSYEQMSMYTVYNNLGGEHSEVSGMAISVPGRPNTLTLEKKSVIPNDSGRYGCAYETVEVDASRLDQADVNWITVTVN